MSNRPEWPDELVARIRHRVDIQGQGADEHVRKLLDIAAEFGYAHPAGWREAGARECEREAKTDDEAGLHERAKSLKFAADFLRYMEGDARASEPSTQAVTREEFDELLSCLIELAGSVHCDAVIRKPVLSRLQKLAASAGGSETVATVGGR